MIRSWRNAATRKLWEGHSSNQFRSLDIDAAIDLLLALNVAKSLQDLSPLRSVGLHKLKGARKKQWAMTVNDRWRICFEFRKGDAFDVLEGFAKKRARFDIVIIDTPPLLPVTDAAVLSTIAGGTVVVVGAGRVDRDHLARSLQSLEAVKGRVLGLVLNLIPTKGTDHYYNYRDGYAPKSQHQKSPRPKQRAKAAS